MYALDDVPDVSAERPFTFRGRFVTYALSFFDEGDGGSHLDLTNGNVRSAPAGGPPRVVLSPAGTFAWIAKPFYFGGYEVYKSDAAGRYTLLAGGYDIDPDSLERHGREVSWTQGGETRTARLRRRPVAPLERIKPERWSIRSR